MSVSTRSLTVRVVLFARYAEVVGTEACRVELPAPATVGDVLAAFKADLPAARDLPDRPLCACNHRQASLDDPVGDGDEIALLPPLAGG